VAMGQMIGIGQHAEVKINQRLLDMMYGSTPDNTGTP
jgi:hypothetical protein